MLSPIRRGVWTCIFSSWRYLEGNSEIIIDNAWTLTGWAQERLVINGDTTAETSGWWRFTQSFAEPWLSRIGETELKVSLRAAMFTVTIHVEVDGRVLEAERYLTFDWAGPRRQWPPLDDAALQAVARNLRINASPTVS